jgi:hypothetical protein
MRGITHKCTIFATSAASAKGTIKIVHGTTVSIVMYAAVGITMRGRVLGNRGIGAEHVIVDIVALAVNVITVVVIVPNVPIWRPLWHLW